MWEGQWLLSVLRGEFIDRCPIDKPVQCGDHRRALPSGMFGRAVYCVGKEVLRRPRMCNHVVQLGNLLTNSLTPLRAGSVENSRSGLERESEPVGNLDERQPAQLLRSVHAPPGLPYRRTHQSALVVVAQRRGAELEPSRSPADRNQVHTAI